MAELENKCQEKCSPLLRTGCPSHSAINTAWSVSGQAWGHQESEGDLGLQAQLLWTFSLVPSALRGVLGGEGVTPDLPNMPQASVFCRAEATNWLMGEAGRESGSRGVWEKVICYNFLGLSKAGTIQVPKSGSLGGRNYNSSQPIPWESPASPNPSPLNIHTCGPKEGVSSQ